MMKRPDRDRGLRGRRQPRAAHVGANPRPKLHGPERLGDVVVGAGVEQPRLLVLGMPRREHDDGNVRVFADARQTSTPSMSGRPRSSTITSGRSRRAGSRASRPVPASRQRPTSRPTASQTARRIFASSSTIRRVGREDGAASASPDDTGLGPRIASVGLARGGAGQRDQSVPSVPGAAIPPAAVGSPLNIHSNATLISAMATGPAT